MLFDRVFLCSALALAFVTGCGSEEATPRSGSAPGMGPGQVPSQADCPSQPVPRTPLRRLTRFEYQNAVRDLLNVDASAAQQLPPDEVTNGFDNNAAVLTVSALHAEKYVLVAEALARLAVQDVPALVGCDAAAIGEEACAQAFARRLGRRAFRRQTTALDEQALLSAYAAGRAGGTFAEGIEVMVRSALQSPAFLYRLETSSTSESGAQVPVSPEELATRLSFLVWSSGPDDALLDAAARGELSTKAQVAAKAREMLMQRPARAALATFFEQWTGARRLEITSKSVASFPEFTSELKGAMAAELPAFIEHVLWSGDRSLESLLTAPVAFVDAGLASLYGVAAPPPGNQGLLRVELPAAQGRSGLLTQAGFLSVQAHPDQTSPVLRGKFVRAMLLCEPPVPPPPDVDVSVPTLDEGGTARARLAAHLAVGSSCNGCHTLLDPIGLAFEGFDAVGRHRETEAGQVLDLSGAIVGASDASLAEPFVGVREMAQKLAASSQVRACVATQWFRYAAGRSEADADACSLRVMRDGFESSGGDVLELIVATTQTDAFWFRSPITP